MDTPAIEISDLWFAYGGVRVLEQVNLTLPRGDFLAVLGPNGGGKSTLLRLILGLLKPGGGQLRVLGAAPGQAGGRIGFLPQFTEVSANFPITVLGAVLMGLVRPGISWPRGRAARRNEREAAMVPKNVQDKVNAQKELFKKGEDKVFVGPIKDQAGQVKIAAGVKAEDKELLGMTWFVEGVVGSVQ